MARGLGALVDAAAAGVDGFAAAVERLEPPADFPAALDPLTVAWAARAWRVATRRRSCTSMA